MTRRRLGILHPAIAWLILEAVFFGVGSLALALGEDRPGPALYLGACVLAAAIGVRLAHRFGPFAAGPPRRRTRRPAPRPEPGARRWVPAVLAVAAVAPLVPTILESGLPLFSSDATAARAALVGLPIQFVRVAIPGLACGPAAGVACRATGIRSPSADVAIVGALVAFMLSLASRYLVIELAGRAGPRLASHRARDPSGPRRSRG